MEEKRGREVKEQRKDRIWEGGGIFCVSFFFLFWKVFFFKGAGQHTKQEKKYHLKIELH